MAKTEQALHVENDLWRLKWANLLKLKVLQICGLIIFPDHSLTSEKMLLQP